MVQKILLSDVLPSHSGKIWLKTCGKVSNLVWIFDNALWRELGVSMNVEIGERSTRLGRSADIVAGLSDFFPVSMTF